MALLVETMGRGSRVRCSPASSVLIVSSLLGSLRPILLKEYMRMLYTDAGCKSTMLAWLMVGEMLRVDCLKSQESADRTTASQISRFLPSLKHEHIPILTLLSRRGLAHIDCSEEATGLNCTEFKGYVP